MTSKQTVQKKTTAKAPTAAPGAAKKPVGPELGVTGVAVQSGYIFDEFQRELIGIKGKKKYREMSDGDPTIGAMLYAIESMIKAVTWTFDPSPTDTSGEFAEIAQKMLFEIEDMSFDDVLGEILSMFTYGFALLEIVTVTQDDGVIGLRKLAPRAQETITRWDIDDKGNVAGAWQTDPLSATADIYIPLWKCLHVTTKYNRGNPEGRSMLRNAYKPYHFIDVLTISEAIGAERNLAGLPVLYAPGDKLEDKTAKSSLEQIVRDVRMNEQGGILMPSDVFEDADGKATSVRKYELKLLSADGNASMNTDKIIIRHQNNMARSVLADFLMLGTTGSGGGSFALSANKSELFLRSIEAILKNIAQSIQRQVFPVLWSVNGWPEDTIPTVKPGRVSPVDLAQLGDFVSKMTGSGFTLVDEETEQYLRDSSGLPPAPEGKSYEEALIPDKKPAKTSTEEDDITGEE